MKEKDFSLPICLLLLSACGGGGDSSVDNSTPVVPTTPISNDFNISFAKQNWQQGVTFEQCITVDDSANQTELTMLYGPVGMSIDVNNCIVWSGATVDFGQDYDIHYAISAQREDVTKQLNSKLRVVSRASSIQYPIAFFQQTDFGLLSNDGFFKRIKTVNNSEYTIVNRQSKNYSTVKLDKNNNLTLEKIVPDLLQTQYMTDWGDFDNGSGPALLINEHDKGYYLLSNPSVIYPSSISYDNIALVDILGDPENEVLIAQTTNRDIDSYDFNFYQGEDLVYQTQSVSTLLDRVCDVDGDGIKEINSSARIRSNTLNIPIDIVEYSDFIFDKNTDTCSDIISFPSDRNANFQHMTWSRVNNHSDVLVARQLISEISEEVFVEDVFVGVLSYGENPTLIYNDTTNIVSLLAYTKSSDVNVYNSYHAAVGINFDLVNEKISTQTLSFSTNLGVTLLKDDRIIGIADIDNNGIDELIYEHILTPNDSGYIDFKSENNTLGARVLVAANMDGFDIVPTYVSKVLPFGNDKLLEYKTNVHFTEDGELMLQKENDRVTFDNTLNLISSVKNALTFEQDKCLAWDAECKLTVKLNKETKVLSILDNSTKGIVYEVSNLPIELQTSWTSYVASDGKKSFVLANPEELYLFSL